jgi:hypothetical protein
MLTRGQGRSRGLFLPPVRRLCPNPILPSVGDWLLWLVSYEPLTTAPARRQMETCCLRDIDASASKYREPSELHSPHAPVTILQSEGVAAAYIIVQRRS